MLLHTHLTLLDGSRVRLRLPQARDRAGLLALLGRVGVGIDLLDLQRTLRFDPQRRAVVFATTWTPGAVAGETVVGVGAVTFAHGTPDLLIADEASAPGLGAALADVLHTAASARRAA
ncbi:hypothetical protein DSM112329_05262 [Paraconexibacter sp. AEG42_29]|uniref:Uncharacterized protein n=1 Tax=Paraconexibacter sp. AEG42_29 TaxID=2997339 RepID=A0AAU7B409_9ACTN